jgi:hypothetical protein
LPVRLSNLAELIKIPEGDPAQTLTQLDRHRQNRHQKTLTVLILSPVGDAAAEQQACQKSLQYDLDAPR